MLTSLREANPPKSMKIFCGVGTVLTAAAVIVGLSLITGDSEYASLSGGVILSVAAIQLILLVGLWLVHERAWQAAMVFYTLALLLNIFAQSLMGTLLDSFIILFLLVVQESYRTTTGPKVDTKTGSADR